MGEWMIAEYMDSIDGHLHIDGVDVVPLVRQHGTPLFVFSEQRLRHNVEEIMSAFQNRKVPTRVFFASKANSNIAVLQVIKDTGIDIEVNSGGELFKALEAGIQPNQIIFNGVAKTELEIRKAIERQIFCINVDSAFELERVMKIARELNTRANIALRIVPEVETGSYGGLETGTHETKFGISGDELLESYRTALRNPESLDLIGLHMHIGSQTAHKENYKDAFLELLKKAAELYNETGYLVQHFNVGGGIPVSFIKEGDEYLRQILANDSKHQLSNVYAMLKAGLTVNDVVDATVGQLENVDASKEELDSINPNFRNALSEISVFIEPGRKIVADAAVLLTTVQNFKKRDFTGETWLLLDAGFNTIIESFDYHWYFHAIAANKATQCADHPYKLAGPLCDSGDEFLDIDGLNRLPDYRMLPGDMQPGDVVAFLDVGAYSLEQMSQYNGQPRAAALMIRDDRNVQVIRMRDTYEDLISHDVFLK